MYLHSEKLIYIERLVKYTYSKNKLLYLCLFLSIFSVVVELSAMSTLLPFSYLITGRSVPEDSYWAKVLAYVNLDHGAHAYVLVFAVLFLIRLITQFISEGLNFYLGRKVLAQLSSQAFSSVVKYSSISDVEKHGIGYYVSMAGDEANRASNIITNLNQLVGVTFLATLYYLAIFIYSPVAGVGILVFMIIASLSLIKAFQKSHRLGIHQIAQSRSLNTFFIDALNSLRSVRIFSAEDYVDKSYKYKIFEYTLNLFNIDIINTAMRNVPGLILLVVLFCFVLITPASSFSHLNYAFLITLLVYLIRFFPVVSQCLNIALRIVSDLKLAGDVTALIDQAKKSDSDPLTTKRAIGRVANLKVNIDKFSYDEGRPILNEIDIKFVQGKSYAIIGPSGIGKSSLMDLILKFYPLNHGDILINDISLQEADQNTLRKKVLLVSQRTCIFNDTVLNNISFGLQVDMRDVRWACKIACIDHVIENLPEGYATVINYQGGNLSGGELQRIGIARALLRRPDILILDESTNALDQDVRHVVVENIVREYKDKIVIFVTHDMFVANRIDEIIDLGKINRAVADPKEIIID